MLLNGSAALRLSPASPIQQPLLTEPHSETGTRAPVRRRPLLSVRPMVARSRFLPQQRRNAPSDTRNDNLMGGDIGGWVKMVLPGGLTDWRGRGVTGVGTVCGTDRT
jgi:hypothetical protein